MQKFQEKLQVIDLGEHFGINTIIGVGIIQIGKNVMGLNREVLSVNSDGATNWIETNSGKYFRYQENNPENIMIEDVAHSLSQLCRFSGQCNQFYSVAQHSCIVHDYAPSHLKIEGLLHDASEAFISDIPRPVKTIIPEIKELEQIIQMQVAQRFKFSWPFTSQIEILDSQLMLAEAKQLFTQEVAWTVEGLDPLNVKINHCWNSKVAKAEFLNRFDLLLEFKDGDYKRREPY